MRSTSATAIVTSPAITSPWSSTWSSVSNNDNSSSSSNPNSSSNMNPLEKLKADLNSKAKVEIKQKAKLSPAQSPSPFDSPSDSRLQTRGYSFDERKQAAPEVQKWNVSSSKSSVSICIVRWSTPNCSCSFERRARSSSG